MGPGDEHRAAPGPAGDGVGSRVLLCPEEWEDQAGRTVLDEFHKEGLDPQQCKLDPEALGGSGGRSFTKMAGEYHKEGAPYMEPPPEGVPVPSGGGADGGERAEDSGTAFRGGGRPRSRRPAMMGAPEGGSLKPRFLNVTTMELVSLGLFRALIGKGVRVPIRVPDGIDMDIIVQDRDIVLNTNRIEMIVPELRFWHITYAYRGKAVVEMGRGVEGRLRVHYWNALVFLLAVLWGGRRSRRRLARATRAAAREERRRLSGARAGDAGD